ncbi:hypothetical protein [Pistricoccus aurantiacus]|uniref:Uncharacterized protein n=1 Tax=Pistricoccus aurantiacus TaxID=1883414 RepID=A0A5B8SQA7_9GAMM|nr:hypothetical protein [Pistricoccus aurantiacus]QEA39309.1 hypothetical protein FGL86_09635 [Pistricoccus aurantiacus]
MADLSEDFRLPEPCPQCGSHRVRASQVHNPDDKVFCASCNTYRCLYWEAEEMLDKDSRSEKEKLIEEVENRKSDEPNVD